MAEWVEGRASNPAKGKRGRRSGKSRKGTGRRSRKSNPGSSKGSSRGGRASSMLSGGPKVLGVSLTGVAVESAMLIGGAYAADQIADFIDDTVIEPLDLDGGISGAMGLLVVFGGVFGAHVLGRKLNLGVSILPLAYSGLGVLASRSIREIMGEANDGDVVLDVPSETALGMRGFNIRSNQTSADLARMQGSSMHGEYLLNEQLGIDQPDHSHLQGMSGGFYPAMAAGAAG